MRATEEAARSRDPGHVREIFDRVAARYDLANHVLSAGCDFLWRRRAIENVRYWNAACILDLATGSGDLAIGLQRALPQSEIIGVDFSSEMLARAQQKGLRRTIRADALHLPFADQAFDAVTIAFGLRNMHDWSAALAEMRRVLTRGGHLLILEFSIPQNPLFRRWYRWYLHRILPKVSTILTRQADAYRYLGASIESFPASNQVRALIEANHFRDTSAQPMTGGIVTLYTAVV